ncbi:cupin domain-containing protein [Halomarina ordinaria]|uniref:Cupin domain-containing protein n=1 Tax=Halomarina ordinaria TaxID=3033939 RepID=A0ABD5UAY6_9EURY|nr:cupin domain-containing protein [Halomarina sp. PSRA2]
MRHVRVSDLDSWMGPADVKRPLGRELGTEGLALNYYELAPGESFAFGYHRHADQEEVFYVLSGAVAFETSASADRESASSGANDREPSAEEPSETGREEVVVSAGEAVRFEPGEWQQGWNRGDERCVALALGAPSDTGETTILRECADCGEATPQRIEATDDRDALVTLCEDCGAETGRFD